jgi:hypothetical protein
VSATGEIFEIWGSQPSMNPGGKGGLRVGLNVDNPRSRFGITSRVASGALVSCASVR